MVKVLVCGGRLYDNYKKVKNTLDRFNNLTPITEIIQGGAKGADSLGKLWANENNVICHEEEAQWKKYGLSAGYKRNVEMAELNPHIIIAFPGGTGTNHMKKIGRKYKIKVLDIK